MAETVECLVEEEEGDEVVFGKYANAFRVNQEGDSLLLDFCIHQDGRAKLVSRVRVSQPFFEAIRERMIEGGQPEFHVEDGLLTRDGSIVVFGTTMAIE